MISAPFFETILSTLDCIGIFVKIIEFISRIFNSISYIYMSILHQYYSLGYYGFRVCCEID